MSSSSTLQTIPQRMEASQNDSSSLARKESIKASMLLIGELGRREILRLLTESTNPWQSMSEIQENWGLGYDRCRPALSFLDALNQSRASLYTQLFENMKGKLDQQLDCIKGESGLLLMLRDTIHFLSIRDLKSIPVSIIKRLKQVPDSYLHHLAKKNLLNELPLQIRRQAWELNNNLFAAAIEGPCRECMATAQTSAGVNRADPNGPIKLLVDYIGQSENLFAVFANLCALKCREEMQPYWGSVIRHVLMGIQDEGQKIQSLGKLDELAWLFDHCRRQQGRLDVASLLKIVDCLRQLIISQATTEERNFKKLMDENATGHPSAANLLKRKINLVAKSGPVLKRVIVKPPPPSPPKRRSNHSTITLTEPEPTRAPPKGPVIPPDLLKALLKDAWNFMDSIDTSKLFAAPVSDEQAPGYSSVIKKPMDLDTMKVNVENGAYLTLNDFNEHVLRMFRNCRDFNGVFSSYTVYAKKLNKLWGSKLADLRDRLACAMDPSLAVERIVNVSVDGSDRAQADSGVRLLTGGKRERESETESFHDSKSVEFTEENTPQLEQEHQEKIISPPGPVKPFNFLAAADSILMLEPKDALRSLMEQAWEYLRDLDALGFFATPVSDLVAPGYSKLIARPMDLSLVRMKLNKKYKSLEAMGKDVELMVSNCFLYNKDETTEPYAYGRLLRDAWQYLLPSLEALIEGTWDPHAPTPEPPSLTIASSSGPVLITGVPDPVQESRPMKRMKHESDVAVGEEKEAPRSADATEQVEQTEEAGQSNAIENEDDMQVDSGTASDSFPSATVSSSPKKQLGRPRHSETVEAPPPDVILPRIRIRVPSAAAAAAAVAVAPPKPLIIRPPKAPAAPKIRPATSHQLIKSTLLESSEAAIEAMKRQTLALSSIQIAGAPSGLQIDELPYVVASSRLLWALCILRDPQIQGLLRRFLAFRLAHFIGYLVRGLPAASSTAAKPPSATRPTDDPILKLALQLCQLPLDYSDAVPQSDVVLLRVHVPLLLTSIVEKKQARLAEALASTAAPATASTEKPPSNSQFVVTLAELKAISGTIYEQSQSSLLVEPPAPQLALTELLESVSKFVLQILK